MPTTSAIERTLAAIRERGGRVTDQRRALLRVLFEKSELVTADDLVGRVHQQLPEVHLTTVYRFLDTLESLGLVAHVHLGHGPAVYHLTEGHHAHVVCASCGAIAVIDETLLGHWSEQLRSAGGFDLVDQHFALAGRCAACRADQMPARPHGHRPSS